MATNPMQKKAKNSFLLGMLLMLIIAAVVIVLLFMFLKKDQKKQEEQETTQTYVYRLKTSVKSGQTISSNQVVSVLVNSEAVPNTAIPSKTKTTKDGKDVWTDRAFSYDGYKSKIDLEAGTIICDNMLYEEELGNSERIQEYNMLQLPVQLEPGEYIDIRLQMSNGQDFIVVSHKEVIDTTEGTIWLQLSEEEIVLMSNAIVEAYISPASNLYVAKYVEPGTQEAAIITYAPSDAVLQSMRNNPNIVEEAMNKLNMVYNSGIGNEQGQNYRDYYRGWINSELNKYSETAIDNIETSMIEAREKAKEQREIFLNGID